MLKRLFHELNGLARVVSPQVLAGYVVSAGLNAPEVIRSKRLAVVDRTVRGPVCFKTWRGDVVLDCMEIDRELAFDESSVFGLAREIFGRDVYLRAFRRFDAAGEAAADFGGNRGIATLLLASSLRPSEICYVEPDRRYLPVMQRLLRRFPEVHVSNYHGFVGAGPNNNLLDPEAILPSGRIAFLKMDIEGAELPLFADAGAWLDRVDRIAMESHPQWCDVDKVCSILRARGFSVAAVDPMGRGVDPKSAGFVYAARELDWFQPAYRQIAS